MNFIDTKKWSRNKTYEWFKTFSNSTYGCNSKIDVTELVKYSKETSTSFFINMLYIVVKSLNSVEEMRMRIIDDKPCIFDEINPAYTVMTDAGVFENVRHKNYTEYKKFYEVSKKEIDKAKKQSSLKKENYNPKNCWDEYYITCLPWITFTEISHPIPDSVESQCIPRICWDKYEKVDDKYTLTLNITVSHIFVDGYPLSKAFIEIQNSINNIYNILK